MTEPTITDEMREQAKRQPGSWLYLSDPRFAGADVVPPWAVIGGYRIDGDGELGEFQPNPDHQPVPEPANDLEEALLAVLTGGDEERAVSLLATSELFVVTSEEGTDVPVFAVDGVEYVAVFTSERFVPDDVPGSARVSLPQLRAALSERTLAINPDTPLAVSIPGSELAAALDSV